MVHSFNVRPLSYRGKINEHTDIEKTALALQIQKLIHSPFSTPTAMKNVFDVTVIAELTSRIQALTPSTSPAWGKMTVDQMLAHCNVTYEMIYDDIHPVPGMVKRALLKAFVKGAVVGPRPYPKNSPTAPQFRIVGQHDFTREQQRLIAYMNRVQQEGAAAFEGRPSSSFGPLTAAEWNVSFYKHLDHHLTQFGV